MFLSCENPPHATEAIHACAHTNTTVSWDTVARNFASYPHSVPIWELRARLAIHHLSTGKPGSAWKNNERKCSRNNKLSVPGLPGHISITPKRWIFSKQKIRPQYILSLLKRQGVFLATRPRFCGDFIVLEIKIEHVRLFVGLAEINKTFYFVMPLHFGATDRLGSEVHFFSPAIYLFGKTP